MPSQLAFPPQIPLAQKPTPLMPLPADEATGARLWCKRDDLTGAALSGNKVRKLEFVLARALEQGADTLITCGGLQSNHCRATALIAAAHNLRCSLVLRGDPEAVDDGNLLLSRLCGADIAAYPAKQYRSALRELLEERSRQVEAAGGKPYIIPTGASDGVGLWGYVEAARELAQQLYDLDIANPLIVCVAGSGGTLGGLAVGLQHYCPQARVLGVAVCDSAPYFVERVREDVAEAQSLFPGCGLTQPDNFTVVDDYIGPGYAEAYPAVYHTMRDLARSSGLVLDPVYTAKAYHGMLEEMRSGRHSARHIVFVHTGGIYGVFPFREALQQVS